MKKFSVWKKIQLLILILFSGCGILLAASDRLFYERMTEHPTAVWVYVMMWVVLVSSIFFLFLDFMFLSKIKHDYSSLNRVAYSDHLSGIPNRFSCDLLLDKYADRKAPDDLACIMFEITNLASVNRELGHAQGNELIKDFSAILNSAALALCFVGRNGGNQFLAVFEKCTPDKVALFLSRIEEKAAQHNRENHSRPLLYKYGRALNAEEKCEHLTDLIALANSRIGE